MALPEVPAPPSLTSCSPGTRLRTWAAMASTYPLSVGVVAALAVGLDARRERVAQREVVPGRRTWRDAAARRGIPLRGAGGQRSEVDGHEHGGQEADPRDSPPARPRGSTIRVGGGRDPVSAASRA